MENLNTEVHDTLSTNTDLFGIPKDTNSQLHSEEENEYFSENELDIADVVNIKDFAYDVEDPRHFGIFNDDDEDDDEDDEEDQEYDSDEAGYEGKYYDGSEEALLEDGEYYGENGDVVRGDESDTVYTQRTRNQQDKEDTDESGLVHAVALYPFTPENSNELSLVPEQHLIISYECGDGWLVAYDPATGQTGLVPSEYICIVESEPGVDEEDEEEEEEDDAEFEDDDVENAQQFMPEILGDDTNDASPQHITNSLQNLSV